MNASRPVELKNSYTTGEVARMLGLSEVSIHRYCVSGILRARRPRAGTRFRIPRAQVEKLLEQRRVEVPGLWPKRERIFVVDDDPRVCRIVAHYFRLHSVPIDVETFGTVEEALERLNLPPLPRLIVVDWHFKGKGALQGEAAVKGLSLSPRTRTIPVMLMTATDPPAARRAKERLGVLEVIEKPLVLEKLKDTIWVHVFGRDRRKEQGDKRRPMGVKIPR